MKRILGLDLGTNSIGWALIKKDSESKKGEIEKMGSRIIPMSQDVLDTFTGGKPLETQTAMRTGYRGLRRLRERHLLRRERLHRVLNILGFLPKHYAKEIDFSKRFGQFIEGAEPKIAYNEKAFVFKNSFFEMVNEFKNTQPQLFYTKPNGQETKIPHDWTIYYLRKKALTQKIEKEELAWIILNFNQKRGYYQLRGEEVEENSNKLVEFHSLKIIEVEADEKPNRKGDLWYSLQLENGWTYRRSSKTPLFDWKDKTRDFIVTTDLNEDGTVKKDREGNEKRSFRAPKEDDWTLLKKKTEQNIISSRKTVGTYIYENLLINSKQKIRGKLVRTIERKFYKEELKAILNKQIELQPELFTDNLFNDCIRELYRSNKAQQFELSKRDFIHLFLEDIIFYQRPLKSQKSTIGNCVLEHREYKDKDGKNIKRYLKVIPKSNPLFQEFRVWQWMYNLKIYKRDDEKDVSNEFLKTPENWEKLFDFLMQQKEVNHKAVLNYFLTPIVKEKYPDLKPKVFKQEVEKEIAKYRWNYVFDDSKEKEDEKSKKYPCNTTGYEMRRRLEKVNNIPSNFLTRKVEQHLWHIIYSVTDRREYEAALISFANKYCLDCDSFVDNFKRFPPFKSEYGSFSEKAIKKLLPLMRLGKYWNWEALDTKTKDRISKIITGEYDEKIKIRVREKAINLTENNDFQGLQLWLAQYIVYNRHSEGDTTGKWNSVSDLEEYLKGFKQHSLRNPIVEQLVTETLRVVRDIWLQFGNGEEGFFDEIHVELGRDMKNPTDVRKRMTNRITENENTNLRVKAMLLEMMNDSSIENIRPYSPSQQEILKIYEEGVLNSGIIIEDDILKISKKAEPTKSEIQRYKLWLEQKYRSPYTGELISLSKLFTEEYQIEHIIPKSRYFDDGFNNKVICEAAVNQLKDKQLGLEFIKNHHGQKVECGKGKIVEILNENEYQKLIKDHYAKNRVKRQNLLLEEIPEKMIARQMNDTRYVSKFVSMLLSNIVRSDDKDDGVNSKNLILLNGKITSKLKRDWGLNDVWNELILPRFERMNKLTNSQDFTTWNEKHQKYLPTVPIELSKNFQKKRIDHRHHAMDALVVACATRDHVNLLNNLSANSVKLRYDLQHKLRNKKKWIDKNRVERTKFTDFIKPWDTFTACAKNELDRIVVSFKKNTRVINRAVNKYWAYRDEKGNPTEKKNLLSQKGVNWAIRKPLHTPMPYSKKDYSFAILKIAENLSKKDTIIDVSVKNKVEDVLNRFENNVTITRNFLKENPIANDFGEPITKTAFKIIVDKYRRRQPFSVLSNRGQGGIKTLEDAFKFLNKVADYGLRRDLLTHLRVNENNINLAFSAEGIDNFNENRTIPVLRLPIAESGTSRFIVGNNIGTKHKWVEAEKGTNLYFVVYWNKEKKKREFDTIPLNEVIAHQKNEAHLPKNQRTEIPIKAEKGKFLFSLSPNDLVYVPTKEETENIELIEFMKLTNSQVNRIYKMVSTTKRECHFIPVSNATEIKKNENGTNSKNERIQDFFDGNCPIDLKGKPSMIKNICWKLEIDRLGVIKKAIS